MQLKTNLIKQTAIRCYSNCFGDHKPVKTWSTYKLNNGMQMPMFGLGTFSGYEANSSIYTHFKPPSRNVVKAVKYAIDVGYRLIDTAFVYGNEKEVGIAVRDKINEGKIKREDIFITSKLWNTFHSRRRAPGALGATLRNLGMDYVDLYLIHWPMGFRETGELFPRDRYGNLCYSDVDYVETWLALETLMREGLTRALGVSNFSVRQLMRLIQCCDVKPVTNQIECHPYLIQRKLSLFCELEDIAITAYSPLGAPKPDYAPLLNDPVVVRIAKERGRTPAQVLIRYQLDRGHICIPKTFNPEQIKSNYDVFDFELNSAEMNQLNALDKNGKVRYVDLADTHKLNPFIEDDYR